MGGKTKFNGEPRWRGGTGLMKNQDGRNRSLMKNQDGPQNGAL